jgi:hypothetical protein
MAEKWIQNAHLRQGALHRALHVPAGENIPASKLMTALHSSNPHMRKMANFARNAKKFKH